MPGYESYSRRGIANGSREVRPGHKSHKNLSEVEEQKSEREAPAQMMRHRHMGSDIVISALRKKEPNRHREKLLSEFLEAKKGLTPEPGLTSNGTNEAEPRKRVFLLERLTECRIRSLTTPCSRTRSNPKRAGFLPSRTSRTKTYT